ncbi:MAG TPA: OmpH family outer membrane protein [Chlamydiales bacterium]|nr:OmpH family outer membrane protein [Chlamydiales bacterium]
MKKIFLAAALIAGSFVFADTLMTGVVNFSSCVSDSKYGKKEQENFESLRKQMATMIESTESQMKEIATKCEDTEYLDSLTPKAEEELKVKFQSLQEELSRYQNQFYQVLQHANQQVVQKINTAIAAASKEIAEKSKLDYVINKEACFYIRPGLDVTAQVIAEMDRKFEIDAKQKKISDNSEIEANPALIKQ